VEVDEVAQRLVRECSRDLLDKWENDPNLAGAFIVTLVDPKSLEVEVRQMGKVAKFSPRQFRNAMKVAGDSDTWGWPCAPKGLGYPIKFEGTLVGICLLFTASGAPISSKWTGQVIDFAQKVGPLLLNKSTKPVPALKTLANVIPKKPDKSEEKPKSSEKKPHWERSKTRVTAPVPEELAVYLLLDYRPLF
jgi:hypothetical protein